MFPQLYDKNKNLLAVLDNIIQDSARIRRVVNGEFIFEFDAFEKELKSEYFHEENMIVIDGQTFDIAYIEQKHEDNSVAYRIKCEHVNYRLIDGEENYYTAYTFIGTPSQILTNILQDTPFTVGQIDYNQTITITAKEITKKELIYELANLLGGEIEYTNLGWTINILNTIGQDNGFQARFGKNLKGITKIIDKRGQIKTSYQIDLVELKNSNQYKELGLADLEVIGLGDTITIIDEIIGINIQNRVKSIEYNPIFAINTKLEIANTIDLITDKISQIETDITQVSKDVDELGETALRQDRVYNGVYINSDEGFVATRSDNKAKAVFNATDGISLYSNTGNGLKRNFYVGTDGRIKASGIDIDGSGTFSGNLSAAGGTFTGSLQGADGTFSGNLRAAGGTFTGTLQGVDGTFSGNLRAAGGTFSGELLGATGLFTGTVQVGGSDGTLVISGESGGGTGQLEFYRGSSFSAPDIIINYDSAYKAFTIMDFGTNNSCDLMFQGDIVLWSRGDIDLDPWGRLYYAGDEVATETWCYNNFLLYGENEYVSSYYSDQKITLAATDKGIVVRVNGAVKGNLFYT